MLLALSACNTIVNNSPSQNDASSKLEAEQLDHSFDLCKYSTQKGIAELISVSQEFYGFVFFPGNIEFAIKREHLPSKPSKGEEYRAIYEELVQGGDNCTETDPQIMNLPH
jgi:hypothetical protein